MKRLKTYESFTTNENIISKVKSYFNKDKEETELSEIEKLKKEREETEFALRMAYATPDDSMDTYHFKGEEEVKHLQNKLKSIDKKIKNFESFLIMENVYEYGCVMLYFDVNQWDKVQSIVEDSDISQDGRETEPHVTLLYGLHSDIEDSEVESLIEKIKKTDFELKNISTFNNKDFDVVKFDVENDYLHELNSWFTKLPHTTDYPDYHPHCTIAYVKPGEGDKYKQLLEEPINVTSSKVVYSKPNGEKKEYPF